MNILYDESPAFLQILSGLCTNLSAAAIAYVVLLPQFITSHNLGSLFILIISLIEGILFFRLAVMFQKLI
jgi:hypothetical protein